MEIIALDIALFPPNIIMDIAIAINQKAVEQGKERFVMSKEDFIPHISLAMACIKKSNFKEVSALTDKICSRHKILLLSLDFLAVVERGGLRKGALAVGLTSELLALHQEFVQMLKPFIVFCEDPAVLVDGKKTGLGPTSSLYLNKYEKHYSGENYHPHITLNCFDTDEYVDSSQFPISFQGKRIALCQVGDGCTCRQVMAEFSLE